jgi:ABC-type transporter Mla subunit MlaD
MRRIAAATVLTLAVGALLVFGLGARGGGAAPYQVRAIFDNASAVVTGEDVRIAGAPVGTIVSEGVTRDKQAALTLEIGNSAFVPFHANATCAIRVQSVIGEKFVDCSPGTSSSPTLTRIHHGPGTGDYYLPVSQTSSPVDFDIVQGISRLPVREQFALILNELGTGLAARGSDLNTVILRADPALGYTDRVLQILARQNRQLAQLATDSNTVLGPLARVKRELQGFVVQTNTTSVASAARATDIARSFHLLPGFLRQLRPLMADLGSLADQGTPLFTTLSQAASSIDSQWEKLAPFARATRTSLIALGRSAVQQQPALLATIPLDRRLERLGRATAPSAVALNQLLSSLQTTGGIQQLMALLLNGTGATNGLDADGHYIRTEALVGSCTPYAKVPVPGCSENFGASGAAADATRLGLVRDEPAVAAAVRAVQKTTSKPPSRVLSGLLGYLLKGGA